ncbi:squalene--hopene cyclase [Peribacillus sp. SI8-4]|uniref:squalene--hopene cyclase n=1 Tax=Peribacillus sp. SI8-4 TaxID=3048009 RepID=UPI002557950A|nr:squalene--hopene cyclase [Peribacillus sp. SI8-4]
MNENVQGEINRLIQQVKRDQTADGSWNYPFDTGITADAYMIIVLKLLDMEDPPLIEALVKRIESRQTENGSWKLFQDELDGNVTVTIEAYYGLLFSGLRNKHDHHMRKAKQFILSKGGIKQAKALTKMMLAVTGEYKWPRLFPIPLEAVLLPPTFFVSIYDLSVYGRVNMIPILLLGHKRYQIKGPNTPSLKDLFLMREDRSEEHAWEEYRSEEYRSFFSNLQSCVKTLIGFPDYLHSLALDSTKRYMLDRIEPDGTLYNYFGSTFFMIFALLSIGYPKNDPVIVKAVAGLKGMACSIDGQTHIQFTTAHVWNTSLISYALQEAGLPCEDETVHAANQYLLSRQHYMYGDWLIHNPDAIPGGWGFSDMNTMNPDVDDTTATLRALANQIREATDNRDSWQRGVSFTISMQNEDGGFPAFERNNDHKWLQLLPLEGSKYLLTDPSTADLTGRTLEFLGNYTNMKMPEEVSKRAVDWLLQDQKRDGSWYGRWGICYLYGTWSALTGLKAAGQSSEHPSIRKAAAWLKKIQNKDGGWGESCYSDIKERYIPLGASNLTHTAWAVDALIAISDEPTAEIEKGIAYLIRSGEAGSWTDDYPVGQAMADFLYIHYHSYRYIYPLLALSHYKNKFLNA